MNRAERLKVLQEKVKAQKEGVPMMPPAAAPPAPRKEGFMEQSTLNNAFAIIIYTALALVAAFLAYKFLLPIVGTGGKRALNRARAALRYSK